MRTVPPYGAYYPVVDPEENPAAPTPKPVYRKMALTEFTASVDRGNTELSLTHEFAPVVTDRVRVILRKGRFDDPTHPDVPDVTVLSGGRTVACRALMPKRIIKKFPIVGNDYRDFLVSLCLNISIILLPTLRK